MRQTIIALFGATALGIACVPTALAADIPARTYTKAPAMADPAYSWTGWYAGLNAGGNRATSSDPTTMVQGTCALCFVAPIPGAVSAAGGAQHLKTTGFTGGIQGGYNWQSGNLVAGVEADFEYFRTAGSTSTSGPIFGIPSAFTVNSSLTTDWLLTLRPRVGVAANNWLFYGTGGLAVTKLNANWSFSETIDLSRETALGVADQGRMGRRWRRRDRVARAICRSGSSTFM